LDSSAIAGSINQLRTNPEAPHTLSMTYDNSPGWSDALYLSAIRAACAMQHHGVDSSDHDPLENMGAAIEALDGPCLAIGLSANLGLFAVAEELKLKTLFNGHGGDEVVSWGAGRLIELAQEGRWIALWRESEGIARITNTARWRIFDRHLLYNPAWRTLRRLFWRLRQGLRIGPQPDAQTTSTKATLLSVELDAAHPEGAEDRPSPAQGNVTERDLQQRILKDPLQAHSLETLTLAARHFGIELAMPFYGRELVEFSLSLPAEWKLRGGQTRFVLSEAMRGRIPEKIAKRTDKHDFGQDFVRNVITSEMIRNLTRDPSDTLLPYVNADRLRSIWAKVEHNQNAVSVHDARALWMVAVLALWLDSDRDACLRA
ncbi:MAG: asparagine synthase C-terminal domain-containing protein, partial [Pseudomonadota bacterium]